MIEEILYESHSVGLRSDNSGHDIMGSEDFKERRVDAPSAIENS